MRIKRIFGVAVTGCILLSSIAGCGGRSSSLEADMMEYLSDKYDIDVTVVRSEDLRGKTPYDKDYYGTDYIVEEDGYEFEVHYTEKDGFSDNYLLGEISSDFMDILNDEFGRSTVRNLDVEFTMGYVDDSICSLDDLEDSDTGIAVTILSSGFDLENWENLEVPAYSEAFVIYVSDFKGNEIPDRKVAPIGGEVEPGVDAVRPSKGDWCLYNYYAYFDMAEECKWVVREYETVVMDGITITYDRNSGVYVEEIDNSVESSLPAFHFYMDDPTFVEFIFDEEMELTGSLGNDVGARPIELDDTYIHDNGSYRINIDIDRSVDVIFVYS